MNIVYETIIGVYYALAIFLCFFITGHKKSRGDEMQKEIRRQATIASWIGIIIYSLEKGVRGFLLSENMYANNNSLTVGPFVPQEVSHFLNQGFDVLLVGFIFYVVFYIKARRQFS